MKIKSVVTQTRYKDGWIKNRFGDCATPISTDVLLKLRSSVKDVARTRAGFVPREVEQLAAKFENAPQGITDKDFIFGYEGSDGWVKGSIESDPALQEYIRLFPGDWEIVQKALGLVRTKSQHACGWVIANEPITNFIPTTRVGDGVFPVTQYTAGSVEAVGGLKMDFLSVNSLNDISVALKLVRERSGWVPQDVQIDGETVLAHEVLPHHGQLYNIWELPEDQAVFNDFCEGKTETVFQFAQSAALQGLRHFNTIRGHTEKGTPIKALDSIEALAAFTALNRPGPLDYYIDNGKGGKHNMLVEYSRRARGEQAIGNIKALDEILPETYGVITYQEQLQKIFYVLGKTTLEEADEFRVHISKKQAAKVVKDKEVFMRGAIEAIGHEDAGRVWHSMETFANYGFNKSHAVAYVIISYACAFLKHHYPLEWWTAVLRHASKDEVSETFWNFCGHLIDLPDIKLSGPTFEIQGERIRAPLSLLHGIGEAAHNQMVKHAPYASLEDFCQKIQDHKEAGASVVYKPKEIKIKEGRKVIRTETQMVPTKRLGRSALNSKVIGTLAVSGAFDSFFPAGTAVLDMLTKFNEVMAQVSGKKQEKVPGVFQTLNAFSKYQLRKAVLAAYNDNLEPYLMDFNPPGLIIVENDRPEFQIKDRAGAIVNYGEMMYIEATDPWPPGLVASVAVVGYIGSTRKFNYGPDRKKEAMEIVLHASGGNIQAVKWPERTGKLPSHISKVDDLNGAIAVVLYTKMKGDKPFSVEDLVILQAPLDLSAESSPDPE